MAELERLLPTVTEAWYSLMYVVKGVVFVAPLLFALLHPSARRSRLVHAGFALLLISFLPLLLVGTLYRDDSDFIGNLLLSGLLAGFVSPIAVLLVIAGTVVAIMTRRMT